MRGRGSGPQGAEFGDERKGDVIKLKFIRRLGLESQLHSLSSSVPISTF